MRVSQEQKEAATSIRGMAMMEREPTETSREALGTARERVVGGGRRGRRGAGMQ